MRTRAASEPRADGPALQVLRTEGRRARGPRCEGSTRRTDAVPERALRSSRVALLPVIPFWSWSIRRLAKALCAEPTSTRRTVAGHAPASSGLTRPRRSPPRFGYARPVLPRNRAPWRGPDDRKLETCKLNDVDPQAWLADVLARLRDHPASRIFEMLPWSWKAARLAIAICIIHLSPRPDQPEELLRCICACNARRILLTAFN